MLVNVIRGFLGKWCTDYLLVNHSPDTKATKEMRRVGYPVSLLSSHFAAASRLPNILQLKPLFRHTVS
jgi:hypothetical protein